MPPGGPRGPPEHVPRPGQGRVNNVDSRTTRVNNQAKLKLKPKPAKAARLKASRALYYYRGNPWPRASRPACPPEPLNADSQACSRSPVPHSKTRRIRHAFVSRVYFKSNHGHDLHFRSTYHPLVP
eukprot:scaffold53282_cov30-Phaeocystis_antarctica.AAC.1